MNSGQVWLINRLWGREGAGKAWGREGQIPTHPRLGSRRALYKRKDAQEGHCLQGALWSHTAYEKYLHVFATLGLGALSCQVGTWGMLEPSALRWQPQDPVLASL